MRISYWSSDVCSSDLDRRDDPFLPGRGLADRVVEGEGTVEDAAADLAPVGHLAKSGRVERRGQVGIDRLDRGEDGDLGRGDADDMREVDRVANDVGFVLQRSEEHTSELQSLMRISY